MTTIEEAMKTTEIHPLRKAPYVLAATRAIVQREFSSLKQKQPRLLQLALNEAEAIAWQTGFPELVFPTLAVEKAQKVATWYERQEAMRRSAAVLDFAA